MHLYPGLFFFNMNLLPGLRASSCEPRADRRKEESIYKTPKLARSSQLVARSFTSGLYAPYEEFIFKLPENHTNYV